MSNTFKAGDEVCITIPNTLTEDASNAKQCARDTKAGNVYTLKTVGLANIMGIQVREPDCVTFVDDVGADVDLPYSYVTLAKQ